VSDVSLLCFVPCGIDQLADSVMSYSCDWCPSRLVVMLCRLDLQNFIVLLFSQYEYACTCSDVPMLVDEGRSVGFCLFLD
jgi:hypothetical protein